MLEISTWLRVKVPQLAVNDIWISLGWPILDYPIKIHDVMREVKIWIDTLLVIKGISLRKLRPEETRSTLTMKWAWKVSLAWKEDLVWSVWWNARDVALEVTGTWVLKPLFNLARYWASKIGVANYSDSHSKFRAELQQDRKWIWKMAFKFDKWNKYRPRWDEEMFWLWEDIRDECVVRIKTLLELSDINCNQLVYRLNIPLFWLSRDNARWVSISSVSRVLINDEKNPKIYNNRLDLWPIRYTTIASSDR